PFLPWWGLLLYFAAGLLGAATLIEYMDRAGGVRRRILTFVTFLSRPDFQRRLAFEAERMSSQMRIKLAGLR
ncbi:MAG: hypothetical protein U9N14_00545, partial [Pseudomonadota bacterium]|nr:hypothetical protein [Pseudomonadota bacterium]